MMTFTKIVNNIFHVFIFNIGARIVNVVYILLAIKSLSKSDYALFTNFQAIWGLISTSAFVGFNIALTSQIAKNVNDTKSYQLRFTILISQLILYSIILIIIIIAGENVAVFFFKNKDFYPAILLGAFTAFGIILNNFVLSIYQGKENYKLFNYFNAGRPFFILLPTVYLYLINHLNFYTSAYTYMIGNLIYGLIMIYFGFVKSIKIHELTFISFAAVKQLIYNLRFLLLYFILLSFIQQLDILLLSRYANAHELANYGVSYRYFSMMVLLIGSISIVILPSIANIKDLTHKAFLYKWIKKTIWIIVFIPLFFLVKDLYILINGKEYTYSYCILFIHFLTFIIGIILSPSINILVHNGKYKTLFYISFISFFTCFFGNLLILKFTSLGAIGVSIITLISNITINGGACILIMSERNEPKLSVKENFL